MSTWTDKYDSWKKTKSELELAEILKKGDKEERNLAAQILIDSYGAKVKRYVAEALPPDWVEGVVQEIWEAFYNYVRIREVRNGVSNLLWGIARNKRADAVDKRKRERAIERRAAIENIAGSDNKMIDPLEYLEMAERIREEMEQQRLFLPHFLSKVLFTSLSDCERVFWMLEGVFGYRPRQIAKLTGQHRQDVYSILRRARNNVREYISSDDFKLWQANQELEGATYQALPRNPSWIIERFANPITPQLTHEELKLLALTVEQFQANYVASLVVPWRTDGRQLLDLPKPGLLLTKRCEWEGTEPIAKLMLLRQSLRERQDLSSYTFQVEHLRGDSRLYRVETVPLSTRKPMEYKYVADAREFLSEIDVEGDNIILKPLTSIGFAPVISTWREGEETLRFDTEQTYLSIHDPRMMIPVDLLQRRAVHFYAMDPGFSGYKSHEEGEKKCRQREFAGWNLYRAEQTLQQRRQGWEHANGKGYLADLPARIRRKLNKTLSPETEEVLRAAVEQWKAEPWTTTIYWWQLHKRMGLTWEEYLEAAAELVDRGLIYAMGKPDSELEMLGIEFRKALHRQQFRGSALQVVLGKIVKFIKEIDPGAEHDYFDKRLYSDVKGCLTWHFIAKWYPEMFLSSKTTTEEILAETEEALHRPHIRKRYPVTSEEIDSTVSVVKKDPDYNKFLARAKQAKPDYIVSDDPHLTEMGEYEGIPILTQAQFLELLWSSPKK